MKKLITLTFIAVSFLGKAQTKSPDNKKEILSTTDRIFKDYISPCPVLTVSEYQTQGIKLSEPSFKIYFYNPEKPMLEIIPKYHNHEASKIDSVIIKVNRKNLIWVNDSTAVIKK